MKTVMCISGLGMTYKGILIDKNINVDEELISYFSNCSGLDEYALVYDVEYDCLNIKKWGFNCFTQSEYKLKYP